VGTGDRFVGIPRRTSVLVALGIGLAGLYVFARA
jgi:hypothetical protein